MKISTRSYYGLRAMVFLASQKQFCSIKSIAEAERLPHDYLEKILQKLKKAGLVKSRKGAEGGYFLSSSPKNVKVGRIITALEGKIIYAPCFGDKKCFLAQSCQSRGFWLKLEKAVNKSLNSVSLADLAKKK